MARERHRRSRRWRESAACFSVGAALCGTAAFAALPNEGATLAGPRAIPDFAASARCPKQAADPSQACSFLADEKVAELRAPPGGRAYRETWAGNLRKPFDRGSILLMIQPDGAATLTTPWRKRPFRLKPGELSDFEDAVARSNFGSLPIDNQAYKLCVGGFATTLEAVVAGRYRVAYFDFCGGVSSASVADALDRLYAFALSKSGVRYPLDPKHATYRG
jgi:hypothetical protein